MHKYLPQSKVAEWREEHKPDTCPILAYALDDPVVDHDHKTGMVRGVLSRQGNALLGKIENFYKARCGQAENDLPATLEAIAFYLRNNRTDVLHHVGARQLTSRFGNKKKGEQNDALTELGVTESEQDQLKNTRDRSKLFRDLITGKVTNDKTSVSQAL